MNKVFNLYTQLKLILTITESYTNIKFKSLNIVYNLN